MGWPTVGFPFTHSSTTMGKLASVMLALLIEVQHELVGPLRGVGEAANIQLQTAVLTRRSAPDGAPWLLTAAAASDK
jgi:hypothetical protein